MGIKGLTPLIKQNSPDAIETMNLHKLSGKRIAIDASLFMYKMLINMRRSDKSYFTNEQEEKLKEMFNLVQKPFKTHSPPNRKNFLNYAYIFRKFLELLSYDEFLPFFSELKSREKLYSQDEHWKKICKDLNWEFIPSV